MYQAIDEDGQIVDVLLRDDRATASAVAFFHYAIERQAIERA